MQKFWYHKFFLKKNLYVRPSHVSTAGAFGMFLFLLFWANKVMDVFCHKKVGSGHSAALQGKPQTSIQKHKMVYTSMIMHGIA
jgi:hypothetical protein